MTKSQPIAYLVVENTGPNHRATLRPITPDEEVELYPNEEVVGVIEP